MEQHQFIGCYTSSVPHKETHLQHQFQMFMKEVVWKEQEITKLFFFFSSGNQCYIGTLDAASVWELYHSAMLSACLSIWVLSLLFALVFFPPHDNHLQTIQM